MKASDMLAIFLSEHNASLVFEFIGGAITHLVDSVSQEPRLTRISMHHEQSAGFAAEAVSRIGKGVGVAMATSGPGALNLLTAIGSCYFDSVPCVFITGQVNTYEYKGTSPVRQIGFQETDIVSVARPLTKYAQLVTDASKLQGELQKAFSIALEGRPGPVLLDIPMDVQRAEVSYINQQATENKHSSSDLSAACMTILSRLSMSKRPLILAGGGIRTSGAVDCFRELISITGIPVVSSLMGLDAFPHDNSLYQGMVGAYGNRNANLAIANCDCLLVLGSRLDTRQTGTLPKNFAQSAELYWVDVDPVELQRGHVPVTEAFCFHLADFLPECVRVARFIGFSGLVDWIGMLEHYKESFFSHSQSVDATPENHLIYRVSTKCPAHMTICVDVGQHQMWAAQSFVLREKQRFLTSGGMGAMGFSLPAAIGASLANRKAPVLVIVGDGSIQVNIQDLDTVVSEKLPIKILVLDNAALGMVRQFQEIYFDNRTFGTVKGYSRPNIAEIAKAYGIDAVSRNIDEVDEETIDWLLAGSEPKMLCVALPVQSQVQPKLLVNCNLDDMHPAVEFKHLDERIHSNNHYGCNIK